MKLQSLTESHMQLECTKSARKQRLALGLQATKAVCQSISLDIVQELCESRGGRPGLSVLTSLLVSVDVKLY